MYEINVVIETASNQGAFCDTTTDQTYDPSGAHNIQTTGLNVKVEFRENKIVSVFFRINMINPLRAVSQFLTDDLRSILE